MIASARGHEVYPATLSLAPVVETGNVDGVERKPFGFVRGERPSVAEKHTMLFDFESVALAVESILAVERPSLGVVKVEKPIEHLVRRHDERRLAKVRTYVDEFRTAILAWGAAA